jgi:hypothetical protein
MIEPIDLGPRLEPPRGGLARLRQSIRQSQAPARSRLIWLAAAGTASVAAILVLLAAHSMMQNRRLQLAIQGAVLTAQQTQFDHAAYRVLPSHGRNERIILIGTLPLSTQPSPPGAPRPASGRT